MAIWLEPCTTRGIQFVAKEGQHPIISYERPSISIPLSILIALPRRYML